ncbi:hypothetical protein [Microcoleus sp. F4-D5]
MNFNGDWASPSYKLVGAGSPTASKIASRLDKLAPTPELDRHFQPLAEG